VTATNNGLAANLVRLGLIVTLCPSTNSWSRKPCWKDFRNLANVRGEPLLSHPIIGIGDCCARAANGHATAVLTTNAMNSGRFMCFPRARATLGCQEYSISDRGTCVESHAKLGDFSCLQKRTSHSEYRLLACPSAVRVMSALPPEADIKTDRRYVRHSCSGNFARIAAIRRASRPRGGIYHTENARPIS